MKITNISNKTRLKPLNKKQRDNYRMLSITCELMITAFERIESENKDKRMKISKAYEEAKKEVNNLKSFSESVLDIVFKDEKISSTTTFNEAVNKIDTIIRKTF